MLNEKLISSFKRLNKVAREKRAKKLGYADAASYLNYLLQEPTPTVPTIHIVDILDSSGSMAGGKHRAAKEGINAGIKELKMTGVKYTYTLCDFSTDLRFPYVLANPSDIREIDMTTRDMTSLYDAIGETTNKVVKGIKAGEKVLVNIYTDGQENHSQRFTTSDIRGLIAKYSKEGFTFTFVGTQEDVNVVNIKLNIDMSNTLVHNNTPESIEFSMTATRSARQTYSKAVTRGEDVSVGFYKKVINK